MRRASAVAAITASSISTPGVVTSELPDSSRWDTTTARPDFRATSSRGSRPYGAKATRRHVEAEHLRSLRVDRHLGTKFVECPLTDRSASVKNGIAKLSSRRSKRNVGKAHD